MNFGDFEEEPVHAAGKRCGVQWAPGMGDWFTSWSPRNDDNNAEGFWDHWVDLALAILRDPLTEIVRPEVYWPDTPIRDFYDEAGRYLTKDELNARFPSRGRS